MFGTLLTVCLSRASHNNLQHVILSNMVWPFSFVVFAIGFCFQFHRVWWFGFDKSHRILDSSMSSAIRHDIVCTHFRLTNHYSYLCDLD